MTAPTLWIDITELFGQFAVSSHTTGVSRVIINLADALVEDCGGLFGTVRLVIWHPVRNLPLAIEGLGKLTTFFPRLRTRYATDGMQMPEIRRGILKGLITAIPKPFRFRLFPSMHGVTHFLGWARKAGLAVRPIDFSRDDCLFVPGSFWLDGYAPRLAAGALAKDASVAAFVHDVLLLSHPEWLPPRHAEQFRRGVDAFLPYCSVLACNSANTRDELRAHVSLPPDMPIGICRLADAPALAPSVNPPRSIADLSGGRFALFVSTVTPRKNHRLLVAAWQKLWGILGEETPRLVFVGGGAPDLPLAEALAHAAAAGDRVVRITDVDDPGLEALYRAAWLTLYPSLGEGYGMPAAEALARGKVCLATRCGGLADVSSEFIDPIDPYDPDTVVKQVVAYHKDPARLAAREAQIRARYRPTNWADTARAVCKTLEQAAQSRNR